MNPIRDIAVRQEALIKHQEANFKPRALAAAKDSTALLKSRTINDRVNFEGSSFGIYAESTQKQKERDGRTRSTEGNTLFDSGFSSLAYPNVNFSDTNQMWNQTQASVLSESESSCTIRIETIGDRAEVMEGLEDRFGVILKLSVPEVEFIIETFDGHNESDIRQFGLI